MTNHWKNQKNEKKTQISRPDLRFASRENSEQHSKISNTVAEKLCTRRESHLRVLSGVLRPGQLFSSGVADNALRLGPYMRKSKLK